MPFHVLAILILVVVIAGGLTVAAISYLGPGGYLVAALAVTAVLRGFLYLRNRSGQGSEK